MKVSVAFNNVQYPMVPTQLQGPPPRLRYPTVGDKHQFTEFAASVDGILSACSNVHDDIDDLHSFQNQYDSISQAKAGELSFGWCVVYPRNWPLQISSPALWSLTSCIKAIGSLLYCLHSGPLPSLNDLPYHLQSELYHMPPHLDHV